MSGLNHDSDGFLVGARRGDGRALDVLRKIRDDIGYIRQHMNPVRNKSKSSASKASEPVTPIPVKTERPAQPVAEPSTVPSVVARETTTVAMPNAPASVDRQPGNTPEVVPESGRDTQGRFVGEDSGSGVDGVTESHRLRHAVQSIGEAVGGAVDGVRSESAEGVDPAIASMNEIARPLEFGMQVISSFKSGLFSNDKVESSGGSKWYRRLFDQVRGLRKDHNKASAETNRTLQEIEDQPTGGASDRSMWDSLKGLLPTIPGLGRVVGTRGAGRTGNARRNNSQDGHGGTPERNTSRSSGRPGLLRQSMAGLKKVPVLGALLAAGGAALSISATENDDSLSRRDKDRANGNALGGVAGSVGGMMAGAAAGAVLGPVGMVVGGLVGGFLGDQAGQIIGDTVGGWVNDLRAADIPGVISNAWTETTAGIMDGWKSVSDSFSTAVDSAAGFFSDGMSWIESTTGVDFAELGEKATGLVTESASAAGAFLKDETTIGRAVTGFYDEAVSWVSGDEEVRTAETSVAQPAPDSLATNRAVTASGRAPKAMSALRPVATSEPVAATPISKSGPKGGLEINVNSEPSEAGQDVRDRSLAHAATGGMVNP